jgi:signal transduction histidine kinase
VSESFPAPAGGRPSPRFLARTMRRTLAESLYLLTAPAAAIAGLTLLLGGLCSAVAGRLRSGRLRAAARRPAPARWAAELERWRIARVRAVVTGARPAAAPPDASGPVRWLEAAHPVLAFPVALVTSAVTGLWWFAGLAAVTVALRHPDGAGASRPGSAQAATTLGFSSPDARLAAGTALGLLLLITLPLVTRAGLAVQAGLGQALLSDTSALRRRIIGLEQERDAARAQTAAAVSAEAVALRRLERDIHDGPQQRLVRLALELGRAQHHLDRRPEAAREALADALVQAQEALDELRALSRGIAPPILADRGLGAALAALAARSPVPAELDAEPLTGRLDPAVETAAYFVLAEALANVAKHSQAGRCVIGLRRDGGTLRTWVTDDGIGGAALAKGHGLRGLHDRVRAAGGALHVTSPPGGPTTVSAELPCR